MKFTIKDSNIFPMPNGWPAPTGDKFLHILTIAYHFKEYIYMICIAGPSIGQAFLEEVSLVSNSNNQEVSANLCRIQDEELKQDLADFIADKKLNDIPVIINKIIDNGHIDWLIN
jgi:hypothetical protein